jgi:thiamine-phosphate pyrophosphorylase
MAYDLYVITDEALSHGLTHTRIAELAVEGGADVIQLREKRLSDRDLYLTAVGISELTKKAGALFIVNDRPDIALAAGADGVHLGQDDLPLPAVRAIAPRPFIIGISVETVREAVLAEEQGADYVAVGPVFPTGSKDDAGPALGTGRVREIRAAVSVPVIAIGGISAQNAGDVIAAGADGLSVISAVVSQDDVTGAARNLRRIIREGKESRDR